MLNFAPRVRMFLAREPCDMRKSLRGLSGLVRGKLREDPLSGNVFCFVNRRRTMLKLLVHVRTGFGIYYLRLSRGTFQLPPMAEGQSRVELDAATLTLILEGIDLRSVTRRLRYRQPSTGMTQN
ncbi:MAG: IS66 family insertion sequence element accessory protein TnpB [Myxococcota bacterium]